MFPPRIGRLLAVTLLATGVVRAAVYEHAPDSSRVLRLNVPDGTTEVRGILVVGNGAGGDSRGQATNGELVAFARSIGFAILATGQWGNFSSYSELTLFESSLAHYADVSGFPELVHAPWIPLGHSNGGQMSYGLNSWRPEKVIAFITSKGCCYSTFTPSEAALRTPGMLVAGETDSATRRTNISALFTLNRPRGALWAWVEEENSGHEEGQSQHLKLPFLAEVYRLRYPRDQSPVNGPIVLKDLNEWEGWLVDQETWESGFTSIYRYDEFPGDPRVLGWVPNEKIARLYQAFSSYNRVSSSVTATSTPRTTPVTLSYSVNLGATPYDRVDFYNGAEWLGQVPGTAGSSPQVNVTPQHTGFYLLHAVITRTDGTKSATSPRRVFVSGVPAQGKYDAWAAAQIPEGLRGRTARPFGDAIPNAVRFAFGIGLEERGGEFVTSEALTTWLEGVPYRTFRYVMDSTAHTAGVSFTPMWTSDLRSWTRLIPGVSPVGSRVVREGDVVRILIADQSAIFVRVRVDDPLP